MNYGIEKSKRRVIFCFLILFVAQISAQNYSNSNLVGTKEASGAEKLFKASLFQTRQEHAEALHHILKSMNYEKQYKLINQVFHKLFPVLKTAKAMLESSNYIPTVNFPINQTIIEALGQVLDNTAFYGEFQLKLPDITDRILKNKNDWFILAKWAIGFSNSTGLYDDKTSHLMHLVCQEINLIERTATFFNPYRISNNQVAFQKKEISSPKKKEISSKKKVIKKGPRMSKTTHVEL